MADLNGGIRFIKGIGEQRAKRLQKLGIHTLRDLISYFPRGYEDRSKSLPIAEVEDGQSVCIEGVVVTQPKLSRIRKGLELLRFDVADDSGRTHVTYFNQAYLKDQIHYGESCRLYGKFTRSGARLEVSNPVLDRTEAGGKTGRIVPVYRLTEGVSQAVLSSAVEQGLDAVGEPFPDVLPAKVRETHQLAGAGYAYRNIHFPKSEENLALARRRLIFEELFIFTCGLGLLRERERGSAGYVMHPADLTQFYAGLPFSLTGAQRRCCAEAAADMCRPQAMNRLVQGDVGSGKTMVAAACIWFAHENGRQAAFMAPTELLAEQHFASLSETLMPYGIKIVLLTGSMRAKQKHEVYTLLETGEADLVVGTHAILSEPVTFARLSLVITDEQHRFGVRQREALSAKGDRPHVLVMSATPIPRTLALMLYGDLDLSILDELPPGRQKVDTFLVDERYRARFLRFAEKLVGEGRQVYIVCPAIEESEQLDIKAATEYAERLRQELPGLRIALLHGRMKAQEKETVMAAFARGETDVLVSTTVIEVGVDVPNAALMIVENAERFGLSQLHQLRGRVGRGRHKSYCVLVNGGGVQARERLGILCKTNDGFKLSEEDLRLRGPGDFFGARQHGLPAMKLADLNEDMVTLQAAQNAAQALLKKDPQLERLEHRQLAQRVQELVREAEN